MYKINSVCDRFFSAIITYKEKKYLWNPLEPDQVQTKPFYKSHLKNAIDFIKHEFRSSASSF